MVRRFISRVNDEIRKYGIRYFLVGIWNTVWGLGCYTALLILFPRVHYLVLGIFSNVLAITNAFLCYKFLVFRTKGHFLKEYFRCYVVYGGGMLLGMCGMFICVTLLGFNAIFSNFFVTFVIFVFSFCGHRFFSFRHKSPAPPDDIG
ncbi:MAG: GtrA family protein [Lentisphaeria bacterium]|nr:GtrA family protein [Lentisphaeria bacterium]